MGLDPATWAWVEKASIVGLLAANIVALLSLGRVAMKLVLGKQVVPGWALEDARQENAYLRRENEALRNVTLRAVRVARVMVDADEET